MRLYVKSRLLAGPAAIISTLAVVMVGTMLVRSPQVRAQNDNDQGNDDQSKIQQGFAIAPCH